ncbi:MAG TPA: hypothetical protein VMW73_01805 [Spirochaetia bacterium]|nr:hypothetical protein [Spirochaetia bacterium]
MAEEIYVPPGGPPRTRVPSAKVYEAMGQEKIRTMIRDFYARLAESPIRDMFSKNLEQSAERSALFFIGFLGGPPLYQQTIGPPMLRQRHIPFRIDEHAREIWLSCFDAVLDDATAKYDFPADEVPVFREFLHQFSSWMVNRSS